MSKFGVNLRPYAHMPRNWIIFATTKTDIPRKNFSAHPPRGHKQEIKRQDSYSHGFKNLGFIRHHSQNLSHCHPPQLRMGSELAPNGHVQLSDRKIPSLQKNDRTLYVCTYTYDDDCFYYHSWRNNVVIAFGTLSSLKLVGWWFEKIHYTSHLPIAENGLHKGSQSNRNDYPLFWSHNRVQQAHSGPLPWIWAVIPPCGWAAGIT